MVFTACQINATSTIAVYNIAFLGNLEQVDMAKNALQQCTSNQSVIYSYDTTVKAKGQSLLCICIACSVLMTSLPLHFRSWICRQPDGCSGWSLVERQKACQGALQLFVTR